MDKYSCFGQQVGFWCCKSPHVGPLTFSIVCLQLLQPNVRCHYPWWSRLSRQSEKHGLKTPFHVLLFLHILATDLSTQRTSPKHDVFRYFAKRQQAIQRVGAIPNVDLSCSFEEHVGPWAFRSILGKGNRVPRPWKCLQGLNRTSICCNIWRLRFSKSP